MAEATRVPMADPVADYLALQGPIDAAIARVLRSGAYALGAEVTAFEDQLARYIGTPYAVGVASGTAALQLALEALGIRRGDEVITAPNSDIATSAAITHAGGRPVFVDCDPSTLNLDPDRVEDAVTSKTRAVMVVHLFGNPARMDALLDIAARRGLAIVEDAALALGAEFRGRKVGSLGSLGCVSLAPTKMLGGYGDGGAVVSNDPALADRVRVLHNYGYRSDAPPDSRALLGGDWTLAAEGHNERLDPLQAAVLGVKLPYLDGQVRRRREIAHRYQNLLRARGIGWQEETAGARHAYSCFTVFVDDRDEVRCRMADAGVATRVYYAPPLHLQPVYGYLGYAVGDLPNVERAAARMVSLPVYPEMRDADVEEVAACLVRALRR